MCFCRRRKGRGENNGERGTYKVMGIRGGWGKRRRKRIVERVWRVRWGGRGEVLLHAYVGLRQSRTNPSLIFANPFIKENPSTPYAED